MKLTSQMSSLVCLLSIFFFSSRRRHTRLQGDWSSDVCSSDLAAIMDAVPPGGVGGTFAGNPIACAAALACIAVLEEQVRSGHAEAVGARIHERSEERACRGRGEMSGGGGSLKKKKETKRKRRA